MSKPTQVLCAALLFATASCSKKADAPSATSAPSATAPATAPESAPGAVSPTAAPQAKPASDPDRAKRLIAAGAVVLDVRTTDEFDADHLPQATNIPVQDLAARLADVETLVGADKSKPVVVYCASGNRATAAKRLLEQAGYSQVVSGGGIDDLR